MKNLKTRKTAPLLKTKSNPTPEKSKIPRIFFIFFFVIIAVNVSYIYISKMTWRGVMVEDAYNKGLHYNDTVAETKKQEELGWSLKTIFKRIGITTDATLRFNLKDRNSDEITDAQFFLTIRRPTQDGLDFVSVVKYEGNSYVANVHFPLKGQWDAEIVIKRGEETLTKRQRYVLE